MNMAPAKRKNVLKVGSEMQREPTVRIYTSFEEENAAEHRRLAAMSPQARLRELAVLQARFWGQDWGMKPITKTATWERVYW